MLCVKVVYVAEVELHTTMMLHYPCANLTL